MTRPTLRMEYLRLLLVITPFPSGKVPRFPQGQLSHYPRDLHLDHLHRHQGWWVGVGEGMLAMRGAHKGKDGAVPLRNGSMGERPPGDPISPYPAMSSLSSSPPLQAAGDTKPCQRRGAGPALHGLHTHLFLPGRLLPQGRLRAPYLQNRWQLDWQTTHLPGCVCPVGEPLHSGRPKGTAELE